MPFMLLSSLVAVIVPAMAVALPQAARPQVDQALVIIDIQNFYFEGGLLPLTGSVEAAGQARKVLERFRELHLPIVHVRHLPKNTAEGEQYQIRAEVKPLAGEKVIIKHYANSFRETDLLDWLRQHAIKRLVIVGMQTQMCVEATARAAADLGFDVTVVSDACATHPLEFGTTKVPAAQVHAVALATLKGTYATVVTTDELLASLDR
jgi:nicotinamidase-related amidase